MINITDLSAIVIFSPYLHLYIHSHPFNPVNQLFRGEVLLHLHDI